MNEKQLINSEQELDALILLEQNKFGQLLTAMKPDIINFVNSFNSHDVHDNARLRITEALSGIVHRLLNNSLIAPLVGDDNEWLAIDDIDSIKVYRNKRMPTVYKTQEGACFFEEAIIFYDIKNNIRFRGKIEGVESTMGVKQFPFIPQSFIVHVIPQEYNLEKNGMKDNVVEINKKHYIYHIKNKTPWNHAKNYYKQLK